MQKLLSITAVLVVVAGSAFAQTSPKFVTSLEGPVANNATVARSMGLDRMSTGSIGTMPQRRMFRPNFVMSPEAHIN